METISLTSRDKLKLMEEIFNQMDIYAMILDETNNIIMINNKVKKDFGNVLGKKCYDIHHKTSAPPYFCAIDLIKEGKLGIETFFDDAVTNKWYEINVSKVLVEDKIYYVHLMTDINEKYVNEQKIIELNQTLRLLNKILRHDILNNLTVISMSLEILKTQDLDLKQKALMSIQKSVELIDKMRDLESAVSSGGRLNIYDLRPIMHELTVNYPVKFDIEGDCKVMADEALVSVFANLVSNAINHGKTEKIDIKIDEDENFCNIKVIDYGIGIPDEIVNHVFEEGYSYGENKGLGLGLYIVKKTIDRYGGKIFLEKTIPKGATFILKLKKE